MEAVKILGVWGCPFSTRVEIALKIKKVDYEISYQNLSNKSEELLKYNPINKSIPVLIHNGQPINESLLILEYIDEIWKNNPLLPTDPYLRAQTRFWVKFIEEKIVFQSGKALPRQGEGTKDSIDELVANLVILENHMNEIKTIRENGNKFIDILGLFVIYWIPILQEFAGKDLLTRDKFPEIFIWSDDIFSCSVIKDNLPDRAKMMAYLRSYLPKVTSDASN